jgi:hypothetical protein
MRAAGWIVAILFTFTGLAVARDPAETFPTSLHGSRPGKDNPDGSQLFFATLTTTDQLIKLGFESRE